jgi:hypothetical protein
MREMMLRQPWRHKKGSSERGDTRAGLLQVWLNVLNLYAVSHRGLWETDIFFWKEGIRRKFVMKKKHLLYPMRSQIVSSFEEFYQAEKEKKKN